MLAFLVLSSHYGRLTVYMCAKPLQLCPALCDPMDYSRPGSSVHGIHQARILEWVAVPSSRGSSQPRDRTCISCLLHWQMGSSPLAPPGKPCGRLSGNHVKTFQYSCLVNPMDRGAWRVTVHRVKNSWT